MFSKKQSNKNEGEQQHESTFVKQTLYFLLFTVLNLGYEYLNQKSQFLAAKKQLYKSEGVFQLLFTCQTLAKNYNQLKANFKRFGYL